MVDLGKAVTAWCFASRWLPQLGWCIQRFHSHPRRPWDPPARWPMSCAAASPTRCWAASASCCSSTGNAMLRVDGNGKSWSFHDFMISYIDKLYDDLCWQVTWWLIWWLRLISYMMTYMITFMRTYMRTYIENLYDLYGSYWCFLRFLQVNDCQ